MKIACGAAQLLLQLHIVIAAVGQLQVASSNICTLRY